MKNASSAEAKEFWLRQTHARYTHHETNRIAEFGLDLIGEAERLRGLLKEALDDEDTTGAPALGWRLRNRIRAELRASLETEAAEPAKEEKRND